MSVVSRSPAETPVKNFVTLEKNAKNDYGNKNFYGLIFSTSDIYAQQHYTNVHYFT
jgi:hypothetical protein